jgi:hypothetical protein
VREVGIGGLTAALKTKENDPAASATRAGVA